MPLNKSGYYRIIKIDAMIRTGRYPSRKKLAEELDVSQDTIKKDLEWMRDFFGAPVKHNRKHNGYYYPEETFRMTAFLLNREQIRALKFVEAMTKKFKGLDLYTPFLESLERSFSFLTKKEIMSSAEVDSLIALSREQNFPGKQNLTAIIQTAENEQKIQFDYEASYTKKSSGRIIHPYIIRESEGFWYLIGYEDKYKNFLTFSLDRITNLRVLDECFVRDEKFNPDEMFKYSYGATAVAGEPEEDIVLKFSPDQKPFLLARPIHWTQTILKDTTETSGYCFIKKNVLVLITQKQ